VKKRFALHVMGGDLLHNALFKKANTLPQRIVQIPKILRLALAFGVASMAGIASAEDKVLTRRFVETHYGAQKMEPFIEARAERTTLKPAEIDRVIAKMHGQLPGFYVQAAGRIAPLLAENHLAKLTQFAMSPAGRKAALADLRWAEEFNEQADICLEEGASWLRSAAKERARAVKAAARLILGDCASLREAAQELRGSMDAAQIKRAQAYVAGGGVRAETIKALTVRAANKAALGLVKTKPLAKESAAALAKDIVDAVAAQRKSWETAAALHYAAAFRPSDLKALAAFMTTEPGAEFLKAKPEIEAALNEAAESWFTAGLDAYLLAGERAATSAAIASAMPMAGPLPDVRPGLALKPAAQPVLTLKPAER
jgi:hypothetical protein